MKPNKFSLLSWFTRSKKRKLYYLGKEDFYQSRNVLNSPSSFNFHREIYHKNHKTQKRIRFYGNPFGVSYKGIRQVFGKPNYLQQKGLALKDQKTVFYKLNIKGIKCLLQMHLYEDQMFFAQIQLRDANSRMRDEFLRLFQMKYNAKSLQWGETIEDESGNKIAMKDDVVPKASFFSGDQKVWKKITDDLDDIAFRESFTHFSLKDTALRWS